MTDFFADTSRLTALPPIDGKYKIQAVIGRGGMGAVFSVIHLPSGQRCAMKVLHASLTEEREAVERFRREVTAMLSMNSAHVVKIFDGGVAREMGGAPYFVMEHLEGVDFATMLRTRGRQPVSDVLAWMQQVGTALSIAHANGLVHRDLKPANLFLASLSDRTQTVKVLDFGVAKLLGDSATLTATNAAVGTPRYMAPEQARASRTVTATADQWSLALITFDLLSGVQYFEGKKTADILANVLFSPMVPPSAKGVLLGEAFDKWFLRSCDRDPRARFGSVNEQMQALALALSQGGPGPYGPADGTDSTTTVPQSQAAFAGSRAEPTLRDAGAHGPSLGSPPSEPRQDSTSRMVPEAPPVLAVQTHKRPADKTMLSLRRSAAPARNRPPMLLFLLLGVVVFMVAAVCALLVGRWALSRTGHGVLGSPTSSAGNV